MTPGGLDDVLLRSLAAMEQAVAVSDMTLPDEPLVWVNAAFTEVSGYPAAEALGRNCRFLQDGLAALGHDTAGPAARIRSLITADRGGTVVVPNRRRDGSVFANELSLSPLRDATGRVRHYVAVQRDVTRELAAAGARDLARAEAAELADQLQRQLVPARLPDLAGHEVAVRYRPATRADGTRGEVSGDFYDLRLLPGGGGLAVIGDVSGRGPRAAATTAALRWAVRGVAGVVDGPAALLGAVADAVHDSLDDRFATVAAVRLPAGAEPAVVALAGHPQPVLLPADGPPRLVGVPGTLLGPFPDVVVADAPVALRAGDALLLFTDGVTEAADPRRELFDEAGLLAALAALAPADRTGPGAAERTADAVLRAVLRHVAGGPTDDLTLMVVRRTGAAGAGA